MISFKHPKPSNNSRSVKTEVFFWVEVGNLDVDMQHLCCIYSAMTGKQLKKLLEQNGWRLDRISGSHHILVRDGKRSIPVPVHGSADLPKGLVHAILKQAEIKE